MLAIAGGKGGAGKTTLALALARTLARDGRDPLVVDADVDMPDLHVLAGADRGPTPDGLADDSRAVEVGDSPVIDDVVQRPQSVPGVAVVPAGRPETVPGLLSVLRRWNGPVLVDCPAGSSEDAARPLRACDRSVLVTTDTPAALEDTLKTAAVARHLGAPPLVALVRGESRRAGAAFECPVQQIPTVDTTLASRPVFAHPRIQALCESVLRHVPAESPPQEPSFECHGRQPSK